MSNRRRAQLSSTAGIMLTKYLTFTANTAGSTISLNVANNASYYYSLDGLSWERYTSNTIVTLININDTVMFGAINNSGKFRFHNYSQFSMTGSIACSGDCTGMLAQNTDRLTECCFRNLFLDCTSLTTAPALPATTLAESCYYSMFQGCTSLTTAPALPATTLAESCYRSMFQGCTSLTTAPALPATTLAYTCYEYMFQGCTSLTTAPALPATTVKSYCYESMFQGCTSLTTAPALPATTLEYACYRLMFQGCTSLTTAPALPATTLAESCYHSMFSTCSALTVVPILRATTLVNYCYGSMFFGCSSLKILESSTSSTQIAWTIPASGTFTNTTTYNQPSIFTNCAGSRSTNDMSGALGESHTYYIQNTPV